MQDQDIESAIQSKGVTAPRVTPDRIDAVIASEYFHVPPGTTLTLCVLTLKNGFQVVGESACASPENFDADIGRSIAHANAKQKIWAMEGYLLRAVLAAQPTVRVVDNNQPGWEIKGETAPNVTLPVGTELFTAKALLR